MVKKGEHCYYRAKDNTMVDLLWSPTLQMFEAWFYNENGCYASGFCGPVYLQENGYEHIGEL